MPSWGNWGASGGGGGGGGGAEGPVGPTGPQGPTGPSGAAGPTGPTGPSGAAGPTGPKGDTGAAGAVGPAGPTGPQGAEGPMGTQGLGIRYISTVATYAELPASAAQGDLYIVSTPAPAVSYVWDAGPAAWLTAGPVQGPQGVDGPAGPTGPTGATGAPGAAGVAGPTGPAGATGPAGPKGDTGATGPAGATGATGPAGPAGPDGTATLPTATTTTLGGVKVGIGLAVTAEGLLSATGGGAGNFLPSTGGTLTGPLKHAACDVSSFDGISVYQYYDGTNYRMQLPGARTGYRIDIATGDFNLSQKLSVTGQATFSNTVNLPGNGTTNSLAFNTTNYNILAGSGGVAWRNNTTNLQVISASTIINYIPMTTPATGAGVQFGSGGAFLGRGSTSTKIKCSGMIELPDLAPTGQEATSKAFTDAAYAPKVIADGRDLMAVIDSLLAEIEILKADVVALKAA